MEKNEKYYEVIEDFPSFSDIPNSIPIARGEIIRKDENYELDPNLRDLNLIYGEVINNGANKRGIFPSGFTKELQIQPTCNIYYRANIDFLDTEEGELAFKSGEIIQYIKPNETFSFHGRIGDRKGVVAFSFVGEYNFPSLGDEYIYLKQNGRINEEITQRDDEFQQLQFDENSHDWALLEEEQIMELMEREEIEPLPKHTVKTHRKIDHFFNILFKNRHREEEVNKAEKLSRIISTIEKCSQKLRNTICGVIEYSSLTINKLISDEGSTSSIYSGKFKRKNQKEITVAVKILKTSYTAENESKIYRELAYLNILDHPNLVRYYGFCYHEKRIHIVMELANSTLFNQLTINKQYLNNNINNSYFMNKSNNNNKSDQMNNKNIKKNEKYIIIEGKQNYFNQFENCKKIAIQIVNAIKFLHDLKIAHRDLKPSNILWFQSGNADPIVKITDFGVSRNVNQTLHRMVTTTYSKGTICYIAPESFHANEMLVDESLLCGDLYSLGYLLYEIYYGEVQVLYSDPSRVYEFYSNTNLNHSSLFFPFPISDHCIWKDLITQCWSYDPSLRPSISLLLQYLESISPINNNNNNDINNSNFNNNNNNSRSHNMKEGGEEILVFVDLNNIYIPVNNKTVPHLPVKTLVEAIDRGRQRVYGIVVGTILPVDFSNYFKEFADLGFVSVIEKDSKKQQWVDSQLHLQIYKYGLQLNSPEKFSNPTVVILTGDGNEHDGLSSFFECVTSLLKDAPRAKVEIWSWRSSLNHQYKQIHHKNFSIVYIDDVVNQNYSVSRKKSANQNTHKQKMIKGNVQVGKKEAKCQFCHKGGHLERDCRKKKNLAKGQPNDRPQVIDLTLDDDENERSVKRRTQSCRGKPKPI